MTERICRTLLIVGVALFVMANRTSELELVLPPECITEMHATPNTECRGPDIDHMTCRHIVITYKKGCEHWNIDKAKR